MNTNPRSRTATSCGAHYNSKGKKSGIRCSTSAHECDGQGAQTFAHVVYYTASVLYNYNKQNVQISFNKSMSFIRKHVSISSLLYFLIMFLNEKIYI